MPITEIAVLIYFHAVIQKRRVPFVLAFILGYRQVTLPYNKHRTAHAIERELFMRLVLVWLKFGGIQDKENKS